MGIGYSYSRARRALLSLMVLALSASALVVAPARPATAAGPFTDVPEGAYYTQAVTWLADTGITTGTSPTTFSPDDPVTRGQMAAFLERYAQTVGDASHGFGDVPSGAYYETSVGFLVERGITTGTSPTTYAPDEVVSRAQMAAFLWRFSGERPASGPSGFTDVPSGVYYTEAVAWLAEERITTGTSDTTYSPDLAVSRGQMATFLWRLAGEPIVGDPGVNRRDDEMTVVAADDEVEFAVLEADGESTIEWIDEDEAPDVGEVVVLGVTDETPEGFLGKVTESSDGMVTTEPTTLTEALPKADFGGTVELEESPELAAAGITLQGLLDEALQSAQLECDASGEYWMEASLTLEPSMTLEASWGLIDGVYFRAGIELVITPELRGHFGGEVNCSATVSVDGPKLSPVTFWVGGWPVVIRPSLSFEAELYAGVRAAAEPYVRYTETVGVEMVYEDKEWSIEYPTDEPSIGACTGDPWAIEADFDSLCFGTAFSGDATIGVELRARLDLLAYGVVGIYLTIGPFLEFTVQLDDPWWGLYGGVRARAGVAVNMFDIWEDDWEFGQIDLYRKTIAAAPPTSDPPDDFLDFTTLKTKQVEAGDAHACAITVDDRIACWGRNSGYQLGVGDPVDEAVAEYVDVLSDAAPIDLGLGNDHSCAVFADGTIECWGRAGQGAIGDGQVVPYAETPQRVSGITTARKVAAGDEVTCAWLIDFSVWCWGDGENAATGLGSYDDVFTPQKVEGMGFVVDVKVSELHACALDAQRRVWCWGNNGYNESDWSDGSDADIMTPRMVPGIENAIGVDVGFGQTCVILAPDRDVECWGRNHRGQLGIGTNVPQTVTEPTEVLLSYPVVDLGMYGDHTCAVVWVTDQDTRSYCWGYNFHDQTAVNTHFTEIHTPGEVTGQNEPLHVTTGGAFSCAQTVGGRTECWGLDAFGQLGNDETLANRASPAYVAEPWP